MGISLQQAERKQVRRIGFAPEFDMIMLGLLGAVTIQMFRIGAHELPAVIFGEAFVLMTLPLILFWRVTKFLGVASNRASSEQSKTKKSVTYGLQAGAFGIVGLTLLAQWISRYFGVGDANEIVALLAIQYVAWYLIVFSGFAIVHCHVFCVFLNSLACAILP